MFRRRRFADVIDRQLRLFEQDEADLIQRCAHAERAYDRSPRDDAEERYGEFLDLVETAGERLADVRDNFAATLVEGTAVEYEAEFNRAAAKRLALFALELDDR